MRACVTPRLLLRTRPYHSPWTPCSSYFCHGCANLHKKSPEEQRKPCVEYVQFLTAHEAELADVIRAVLKTVTEADEELSKRKAEE